jgi:hypothetical protein
MATAPCGWARSVASCNPQGLPNTQAWPDSRRYREKIRTILEAARWRLRLVVGLAQWLRVTLKDCQILRPGRTVAATGKDPHDFAGSTLATAVLWSGQVTEFVPILGTHPSDGRIGSDVAHSNTPARLVVYQTMSDRQSPLPEKSHCCIATEL